MQQVFREGILKQILHSQLALDYQAHNECFLLRFPILETQGNA